MTTTNQMVREFEEVLKAPRVAASHEIHRLADQHGLTDLYADAPGARGGEYAGTVNGQAISCRVHDRDPEADLRALQAAISQTGTTP